MTDRAPRKLTNAEARRIAVRAQLLDAERPTDLVAMVKHLTFVQIDPTAVVAPTADLVPWTRLGNTYDPAQMQAALAKRKLFEQTSQPSRTEPAVAMVRPTADVGLYLAEMADYPNTVRNDWFATNDGFRGRVLDLLRESGPLPSRDIPDTCERPWASTGWTNDRNVTQMLEALSRRGLIAISGRQGKHRLWDLSERVYPAKVKSVPLDKALRIRNEKRLRSLGVARSKYVDDAGEPAEIDGTTGPWRVDPEATATHFEGRTALLSPFDRLIHDRVRALELFDFEYTLEMYKPKDKRRWGFFALPVLHHDRLIGKVDATTDRANSTLRVHAIHQDVRFTRPISKAVNAELDRLAQWLGVDDVTFE